ncbi:MAG: TatD family hydrolase [Phototrophicaceae bacterium]
MTQSKPIFIDTHCHLNFDSFDANRDEIIQQASAVGVTRLIIPAVDLESSQQALDLSSQHEGIFAAVGVHPNSTADFNEQTRQQVRQLSFKDHVVAIGEIGLDYYWDKSPKSTQKVAFEAQLNLAKERELPVIIHNREAHEDIMAILEDWAQDLPPSLMNRAGVLHSFSAPAEIADRALAIGFYLGFTGPITFKNADDLRRVALTVPLDRILLETDAPFLTPHPHRGKRPNKPQYIPFIADRLAALHHLNIEEIAQHTTQNALRLFNLEQTQ